MATKGAKYLKNRMVAKLVTENRQPCVFCQQDVDDEVIYGKLYALGDIQCHYYCVLLSCCLVQKGRDTEGLFGFLYRDILAEVERSKKHKCSYCGRGGANLGCCVTACRKQFHLPCGRQKNAVSLFHGNYKSFCELHAPKQKISDSVMANAKERRRREKMIKAGKIPFSSEDNKQTESSSEAPMVCVICYEEVQGYPTTQTFWPPCCGRDAWLHRSCVQRMALSAGMHYLKCPLCNDKDTFHEAVSEQGYYLPDRDAAWELEQNAFAEIYNRELSCAAEHCKCPYGRSHDELGMWDIKLCLLCGSWGGHAACLELELELGLQLEGARALCAACRPAAAAADLEHLETRLAAVIAAEQAREQANARSGPVMPSRMSLRRTKGRLQTHSATSSSQNLPIHDTVPRKMECQTPVKSDRLSLNLKPPHRPTLFAPNLRSLELPSPLKMLEQTYWEKGGAGDVVLTSEVVDKIRLKFSKPKPLSAKRKIVNDIMDDLFKNVFKENLKSKDPVKEWNSPTKKSLDVSISTCEESLENVEQPMNTNTFETEPNKDQNSEKDVEVPAEIDERSKKERAPDADIDSANENTDILNKETSEQEICLDHGDADLNVNEEKLKDNETIKTDDESSNSTFQLPPEFIAESDDSLPYFNTPSTLKTVEIKQDCSMEISEQEEKVDINVVQLVSGEEKEFIKNLTIKSPVKNKTCSFKFSPADKETLQITNVDIDVESFKDQYLNEVGRDNRQNTHLKDDDGNKLGTLTDLTNTPSRKRKLEIKEEPNKKRRKNKFKLKIRMDAGPRNVKDKKRTKILKKKSDPNAKGRKAKKVKKIPESGNANEENVAGDLQKTTGELENAKNKMRAKKIKKLKRKLLKIRYASVKIKLKDGSETKTKKHKKKQIEKSYKQYILKYSPVQTNKVIAKPEADVSPIKKKYKKPEKPCDKLVQTSIQSFFKPK